MENKIRIFIKNYSNRNEGYILKFDKDLSQFFLDKIIYDLFKNSYRTIEYPFIQYIDKNNEIVSFKNLKNDNLYFIYIRENFDNLTMQASVHQKMNISDILQSGKIEILSEDDYNNNVSLEKYIKLAENMENYETIMNKQKKDIQNNYTEIKKVSQNYCKKMDQQKKNLDQKFSKFSDLKIDLSMMNDEYENILKIVNNSICDLKIDLDELKIQYNNNKDKNLIEI